MRKPTLILGSTGMVGKALLRRLPESFPVTRQGADLRFANEVDQLFSRIRPRQVFLAAAKVGGIGANMLAPVDFLQDNLAIQSNVLAACYRYRVSKVMIFGSSCIYPKFAPQPIREDALLTGPLEPTNEAYAIAKIAGLKLAQAYVRQHGMNIISVMPTNLYGPHDHFGDHGHVVPALMRRFHEAKLSGALRVDVWGSGRPLRELMHVDDLADACAFLMDKYDSPEIINIGTSREISIAALSEMLAAIVGFKGEHVYDTTLPDGTHRKLLDSSKLAALGWYAQIGLREGLESTYGWFTGQRRRYASAAFQSARERRGRGPLPHTVFKSSIPYWDTQA